ncbi:MAG: hypothetical protein M0Z46_12525 [Actinomycetota bacterium]|jgi:hypothetical protein|nr:hypothetical protein [Actinomycetota bacterium]
MLTGDRKEVRTMWMDLFMFLLSALGLIGAGREFLRRGHNLGLWGA